MVQELLMYIVMIIVAGVLSLSLSLFSYFKLENSPGARHYMIAAFLSSLFSFSYVFELTSQTLEEIKFWIGIEYLVMPFIPSFLLLMSCEYLGLQLRKRFLYILFLIPTFTIFSHSTNNLHHLYYLSVKLRSDTPSPIVDLQYGPFFYVHALYLFLCLAISITILLLNLKNQSIRFRMQILTMVIGLFTPVVANHFYLNDLSPYGIDLGPVSMSISFIFHGIALFAYQMFNVLPIAREKVFENILEGVIVLNQNGAIVDYNRAVLPVIPMLSPSSIGKQIEKVLTTNKELATIIRQGKICDYECLGDMKNLYYQVRFSPVAKKNGVKIGEIITFVDITERVELQKKLRQLAIIDGLTQIYNRTFFLEESEKQLHLLKSKGGTFSLIMFDIDYFKKVNDTYGHEAGDMVLSFVANLVKSKVRNPDIFARYGGEEFIIFLPNTDVDHAIELAQFIRMSVSENMIVFANSVINVTCSIGVSCTTITRGDSDSSIKSAIREADQALYSAKGNGRNNIQLYHKELQHI